MEMATLPNLLQDLFDIVAVASVVGGVFVVDIVKKMLKAAIPWPWDQVLQTVK